MTIIKLMQKQRLRALKGAFISGFPYNAQVSLMRSDI